MKKLDQNIIIALAIAMFLISSSLIITQTSFYKEKFSNSKILTKEEVTEKLTDFINNDLLAGQATASIIDIAKGDNFYLTKIEIDGNQFDSYITLDGKIFFPEGYLLE